MPPTRVDGPYHGTLLLLLDNRVRVCRFLCFLQVHCVFEAITEQVTTGVNKVRPATLQILCVH
jgi:hypothetical protein